MTKNISDVLREVDGKFILLYESSDGLYKFAIGEMTLSPENLQQLIGIATNIFEAADRERIGNEILQTIKTK